MRRGVSGEDPVKMRGSWTQRELVLEFTEKTEENGDGVKKGVQLV